MMNPFKFLPILVAGCVFLLSAQAASSNEGAASSPTVMERTGAAIGHGAKAAANGIERGAKAAGHGIERGVQATGRALSKASQKIWVSKPSNS
jgi:hypothetical protein